MIEFFKKVRKYFKRAPDIVYSPSFQAASQDRVPIRQEIPRSPRFFLCTVNLASNGLGAIGAVKYLPETWDRDKIDQVAEEILARPTSVRTCGVGKILSGVVEGVRVEVALIELKNKVRIVTSCHPAWHQEVN